MLKGLQTHFGSPVGDHILTEVRQLGCKLARIDAQSVSIERMLEMVDEVHRNGLVPYVTVASLEAIKALPSHARCEWKNEPDLALGRPTPVPPATYAAELIEAAKVGLASPVQKVGGLVVSNLNKRGHDYILAVITACGGNLPDNVVGAAHRYGDGSYQKAHKLNRWRPLGRFRSREDELRWFKQVIGKGREWGISEWGYPSTDGISEADQAERCRREWDLYESEGADFAVLYQLNDEYSDLPIGNFGIRRTDGSWKPAAFTFQEPGTEG